MTGFTGASFHSAPEKVNFIRDEMATWFGNQVITLPLTGVGANGYQSRLTEQEAAVWLSVRVLQSKIRKGDEDTGRFFTTTFL